MNLLDKELGIIKGNKTFYFEHVKKAIIEDYEDFFMLIDSITASDDWADCKKKLEIHLRNKNRNFGDYLQWKLK